MAKVIDADGHVVEPRAVWTEYTEPEFRDRVIQIRRNDDGLINSGSMAKTAAARRCRWPHR